MKVFFVGALCAALVGCISTTGPNSASQIVVTTETDLSKGLFVGDQVQWNAQTYNSGGNAISATVGWTSAQPTVVSITNAGLMTVVGAGTAFITASSGSAMAVIRILVDANVTGDIAVAPATVTAKIGTPVQFFASLKTTLTNPSRGRTALWTSTNTGQATVDATGKATPLAATTGVSICATAPDVATVMTCATLVITP